jgi:hypothetical protein
MACTLKGTGVDPSPRRTYFLGLGVVLVFLVLNVWVAIDHYQIQYMVTHQTADALVGAKQIAQQRSTLLTARPDSGPIDLQMMQKAGVRVPDSFIQGDSFASPWGKSQLIKQSNVLVWDFYEITTAGCTQLLGNSGSIAGVFSVAASAIANDARASGAGMQTHATDGETGPEALSVTTVQDAAARDERSPRSALQFESQ